MKSSIHHSVASMYTLLPHGNFSSGYKVHEHTGEAARREIPLYSWFTCIISTTVTLIRWSPMGKLQQMELLPSGINQLPHLYFGNKYSLRNPWGEWLTRTNYQAGQKSRRADWSSGTPWLLAREGSSALQVSSSTFLQCSSSTSSGPEVSTSLLRKK